MLTTDRGQTISVTREGIQIDQGEDSQVINFSDIKGVKITDDNILQIISSDVAMQYQLTSTEENQDFINQFGIAKLNFSKSQKTDLTNSNNKGNINQINITVPNTGTDIGGLALLTGKKRVNKVIYALLAIFLGGVGIHKFYAGKIGMGIVFFIFSWTFIPAIIGLIQGIGALARTPDSDGNIYV